MRVAVRADQLEPGDRVLEVAHRNPIFSWVQSVSPGTATEQVRVAFLNGTVAYFINDEELVVERLS
jgi:hypothetical protein